MQSQIKQVYWTFESLESGLSIFKDNKNPALSHEKIMALPVFYSNPFSDRILKVFSKRTGMMNFEEFLNMISVFSENSFLTNKISYAFRIYDFDDDDMLSSEDIQQLLWRMDYRYLFRECDFEDVAKNILSEADLDAKGHLTFTDFYFLIKKCPNFVHSFRIEI